jgi:predicted MPP superfamily phosphohydrolase
MSVVGMIFGVLVMLSIMGGVNFYVARRLYQWLHLLLPHLNPKIFASIYIFLAVALILGFLPIPTAFKSILSWIGLVFYGFFMYLLIFTLATDFVMLIGGLIKIIPSPIPQSVLFFKGLTVVLLSVCFVGYGFYHANQIQFVSYDIPVKDNKLSDEIKIVLIGDLHLGTTINEKNLGKIIQGVNDMKPDMVCIVGDIVNDDFKAIRNPSKASELFKSIVATYGVYACLGNHDGGTTFNEMVNFLEQSNVHLLNDEYEVIDGRLVLFGRLDARPIGGFGELKRQDISEAIASVDTNMPVVVMDHNPSHIKEYGEDVDLLLFGHSHRGQVFPGSFITRAIFTADYGYYQKDANSPHVVVTSGAGVWGPPLRVGTNCEIVSISLH